MRNWSDLRKRALTAALLGPIAILCIWLGGYWWSAIMAVCVAGLAWEWVKLCGASTRRVPGMIVPVSIVLAILAAVLGKPLWGLAILLLGSAATRFLIKAGHPGISRVWLPFGILYVGLAGVSLIELRHDDSLGRDNVIFLILVIWASDISAYVTGRSLGGPKLAAMISPNKTWSGAVGGLAGAVIIGMSVAVLMDRDAGLLQVAVVAALLGIATQAGDLFESWIKRRFGVKDSSGLLPGHGGLLDRLDGVLAAAPLAAFFAVLTGAGGHLWRWV